MGPDTPGDDGNGGRAAAATGRRCGRAPALAALVALVALAVGAGGLAGCSDDGRELRQPRADQTTTTRAPTTTTASVATGPAPPGVLVTSDVLTEAGAVPNRYTCRGEDVSPPLAWGELPAGTAEVAVVMREAATGIIHWVVAGLPPETRELAEGEVPQDAVLARNSFGNRHWDGPCPEGATRYYDIRVYAFGAPLGVAADAEGGEAVTQIEAVQPLASGALSVNASA